jgi:hypothetical protein
MVTFPGIQRGKFHSMATLVSILHARNFGCRIPLFVTDKEMVDKETEFLELAQKIRIAIQLLCEFRAAVDQLHILDRHCRILALKELKMGNLCMSFPANALLLKQIWKGVR